MRKTREAAIFVYRDDRFLVAHRAGDGHWNVIAGQIEEGESFAEGAARELVEEAQLDAPLIDLGLREDYVIEPQFRHLYAPNDRTVTVASYAAVAPQGWEPTLNHEHDEYRWCTRAEALELLYWPEMKTALRVLADRLRVA